MTTTRTTEHPCLHCNRMVDSHRALVEGTKPEPGDFSLCAYCGGLEIYDSISPLSFRLPTDEELQLWREHERRTAADELVKSGDWRKL